MTLCCTSKVSPQSWVADDVFTLQDLHNERIDGSDLRGMVAASSGLSGELRLQLWPPLLGLGPWPAVTRFDDPAASERVLNDDFASLIARASEVSASLVATIDADVPRTENLKPSERAALRSLLIAHCVLEPKWGYFQGMNDIARVVLSATNSGSIRTSGQVDAVHGDGAGAGFSRPPHKVRSPSAEQQPQPEQQVQMPTPQLVLEQDAAIQRQAGQEDDDGVDGVDGRDTGMQQRPMALGRIFWLLKGVLSHSSENWAHAGLEGVWQQAQAVRRILHLVDPKLAQRLDLLDSGVHGLGSKACEEQPLAFLFGPIFLRLKREMVDLEQTMRLWEVCWARGRHFHVLVLAAFVRMQRSKVLARSAQLQGVAQLYQLFGHLHGTQRATPLLEAARELEARKGVLQAVEDAMGAMAIRNFRSIV